MTPLRQQMIQAMQVRGFSPRTHESYLHAVRGLAGHYRRSPEQIGLDELKAYFVHLATERHLSGATCRLYLNGIRFLYLQVLGWSGFDVDIPVPKRPQRIPELLTRAEVGRIIVACDNPKQRMLLSLCYGCGLRVSELVALKVRHIDGERELLRIEQGKGAKDRLVPIGATLLGQLRAYWRVYRPLEWLFATPHGTGAITPETAGRVFRRAKQRAGIEKIGGIHGLRHAYATHQLQAGLPVHELQRLLGHRNIHSTLRYVHWVPEYRAGHGVPDLIAALGVTHG